MVQLMLGTNQNQTVKDAFIKHTPKHPLCADSFSYGVFTQEKRIALTKRNIQINSSDHKRWLALDLDYAGSALACDDHLLGLSPTCVTINPDNNHSHVLFLLKTPIFNSSSKAVKYFADIKTAYNHVLGGDVAYSGTLTKNPLSSAWRNLFSLDRDCMAFELGELAEALPDSVKTLCDAAKSKHIGLQQAKRENAVEGEWIGRNVALFDALRNWAACNVKHYRSTSQNCWLDTLSDKATEINSTFFPALPASEVKSVVKSVSRWIYPHSEIDCMAEAAFKERQSSKGKLGGVKSGKKRLEKAEDKITSAKLMHATGMSIRTIAEKLEVGKSSVARWIGGENQVSHEA